MTPKRVDVRVSGLGGQGAVLVGEILGRAAVYDEKYVVQTQSYGAEARGSAARSEVIISDKEIGFPKVRKCDILVAMSQDALNKHLDDLKENGILLVDKNKVRDVPKVKAKVFSIPATEIAETASKSRIYVNTIMLGALTKITGVVSEEAAKEAIVDTVPKETIETNLESFGRGFEFVGSGD
ncbi:MAG: 2-oxoacid:acceptor oxidoreductase family protein [Candidatus Bathyarchaeota archaeon]|nr:MAG: 2-oxoacid:acceptor oxidoreductase family protein [Candidatus Bathyarchaeota archaeon]